MRVSKREAFLLFILALVGIVGMMIAFIVLPLMNEVNANKLVLEDLNNQKLIIDTSIPNEANLKKQLDTRLIEVSDLLHTFESPINEAQFERWVLPLTTKYNMKVLETNFTDVELTTPISLETQPTVVYYTIRELVEKFNSIAKEEYIVPESESLVLLSKHTYNVNTTYARYVYFLDEVRNWDTSIFITESHYNFEDALATFTFELYTIEQLLPSEIIRDYTSDITAGGTGKGDANEDPHPEGGK